MSDENHDVGMQSPTRTVSEWVSAVVEAERRHSAVRSDDKMEGRPQRIYETELARWYGRLLVRTRP